MLILIQLAQIAKGTLIVTPIKLSTFKLFGELYKVKMCGFYFTDCHQTTYLYCWEPTGQVWMVDLRLC